MGSDMTTTAETAKGSHAFRFLLNPIHVIELMGLPKNYTIRTVVWSDDRASFVVVVDAPEEERFFVPFGEILPVVGATVTVTKGDGGDAIKIGFPQLEETDDAAN